jgi:hypothetical protein
LSVRVEINGRRHYRVQEGVYVPSVTTILGVCAGPRDQAFLEAWARNNPGAKEAAAERGSIIHAACEDYVRGRPVSVPPEIRGFWDGLAFYLDRYDGFVWSEVPLLPEHQHLVDPESGIAMVYSLEYLYAGVPDLIAIRNGAYFLVDFKTSNGPYCRYFPTAENSESGATFGGWKKYVKCATQLAAYKLAIQETLGLRIHRVEILTSTPEITQCFPIHGPELKRFEVRWLQKVRQYYDLLKQQEMEAQAGLLTPA